MQAIIDESVPNAEKYYETYLFEPSPAADINLSADSITTVAHLDFETLLTEMKDIGTGRRGFSCDACITDRIPHAAKARERKCRCSSP